MNINKLWFPWKPGTTSENACLGVHYQCAKFHACIKKCTIRLKFQVMPPDYKAFSRQSAEAALCIVCWVSIMLGYTLDLAKCVLIPTGRILYLRTLVDSELQAFLIPDIEERFAAFREGLLGRKASLPVKMLQKLMGKCVSFTLAFPGAKFYIREMASAIAAAVGKLDTPFSPPLREQITFCHFLNLWTGHIPWRNEEHALLSRWSAVIHKGPDELTFGNFWENDLLPLNINVKEMWAVAKALSLLRRKLGIVVWISRLTTKSLFIPGMEGVRVPNS